MSLARRLKKLPRLAADTTGATSLRQTLEMLPGEAANWSPEQQRNFRVANALSASRVGWAAANLTVKPLKRASWPRTIADVAVFLTDWADGFAARGFRPGSQAKHNLAEADERLAEVKNMESPDQELIDAAQQERDLLKVEFNKIAANSQFGGVMDQLVGDKLSFALLEWSMVREGKLSIESFALRVTRDLAATKSRQEARDRDPTANTAAISTDDPLSGKYSTAGRIVADILARSPLVEKHPALTLAAGKAVDAHLALTGLADVYHFRTDKSLLDTVKNTMAEDGGVSGFVKVISVIAQNIESAKAAAAAKVEIARHL
ncbi:MAG: hypothetical protein LBM73_00150 [Candidatus Nomurabacteria bacterium]|jgi:phosphatidylglycerophosphate synthase|nr:hypothetical protein [Candidatus Nomurabacteria bacterium]